MMRAVVLQQRRRHMGEAWALLRHIPKAEEFVGDIHLPDRPAGQTQPVMRPRGAGLQKDRQARADRILRNDGVVRHVAAKAVPDRIGADRA